MKILFTLFTLITCVYSAYSQDAKLLSDCTITYDVSIEDPKADQETVKAMQGATKVVFIKGTKMRTDFTTPGFKQTVLYDIKSDSMIVLREIGPTKYISYLSEGKREEQNKKFEGIQYEPTDEKKVILGYDCLKVVAKLADGSNYNVYYTPSVTVLNNNYEYQFRKLPGIVLQYEAQSVDGKTKITYTASKITLVPVPIATFDLPKNGYRVL